ncbi:hypothetical protein PAXRUDRAFT_834006 [Paxillus rubicundulus Ve08.2h10]|uniref:BTB domain-containing protein n=1 Tax=Paxillus rubicundulus Ve08.2h10 TaxID=930991 RepID=A0A0D0DMH2_9AGAM|nr:hypothetical protein PAXRUDRAFT_834006 [Paxillus rubicundulus Ve08.2h10]
MGEISKHEQFYVNTVTFLVENCLFKVPRTPFKTESTVFSDMFSLPVGDIEGAEGLDDDKPIQLEGTKKDDFEQLMKVLFHRPNGLSPELPMEVEQWTSVLELSTLWEFSKVRQAAINKLGCFATIPLAKKIALAYEHDVQSWLLPTMQELVRRPEPISMEEARCMGFETALKLASVREQVAFRIVPQQLRCQGYNCNVIRGGGFDKTHQYTTTELIPGPRVDVRELDFTPILCTTFNLTEPVTNSLLVLGEDG